MFSTTPAFLSAEHDYRREQLRRAWGRRSPLPRRLARTAEAPARLQMSATAACTAGAR